VNRQRQAELPTNPRIIKDLEKYTTRIQNSTYRKAVLTYYNESASHILRMTNLIKLGK
jgi:hypothetical protein